MSQPPDNQPLTVAATSRTLADRLQRAASAATYGVPNSPEGYERLTELLLEAFRAVKGLDDGR